MEIKGSIYRVSFYKKETGFTILVLTLNHDYYQNLHTQYNFVGNKVTLIGTLDRIPFVEEEYEFTGDFVIDPSYGLQFKFVNFAHLSINHTESLIQYFSSDLFEGVGIKTAKLVVETLGEDAIEKIKKDRKVLDDINISEKSKDTIYNNIISNEKNQEAFMFFIEHGLSLDMAKKITDIFLDKSVELVKENPYILMNKIEYFGFMKCDKFALKLGIEKHSSLRLKALTEYILKETLYASGNSYSEKRELFYNINKYLKEDAITPEEFLDLLEQLIQDEVIKEENNRLFSYALYLKEVDLSKIIVDRLINNKTTYTSSKIDKALKESEKSINIKLNDEQRLACTKAYMNNLMILTGGPGTGKTTIIKVILDMYVRLHKNNPNVLQGIALLAPTGKASKRLNEVTNVNASTIHKFLGYTKGGSFEYGRYNKKDAQMIIVDEASMMDLPLTYQLFSSLNDNCKIIIVGDVEQLPSVGPGQVLKDMIDSKEIEVVRLQKIHRQSQDSKIIQLAYSVNSGLLPDDFSSHYDDRIFIPTPIDDITNVVSKIIQDKMNDSSIDIHKDIQVLAPMYRCTAGINELNQKIQGLINPKKTLELKSQGQSFRVGDKVIQLVNRSDKNIMNGDIGIIDSFVMKNDLINGLVVEFDFGKVSYNLEEIEDLTLAYAISVHKSQGSEFDIVILPMAMSYSFMFKRKLIYTALTRAKKLLILVGDPKALLRGSGLVEESRKTILKDLIVNGLKNISHTKLTIEDFETEDIKVEEKNQDDISPYDFESVIGEEEYDI